MKNRLIIIIFLICSCQGISAATLRVPSQYQTIQGAINIAEEGDSILVAAGLYDTIPAYDYVAGFENKIGITLISEEGKYATFIDALLCLPIYVLRSSNIIIDGFTIRNGIYNISLIESNNIIISNCDISNAFSHGIYTGNNNNLNIKIINNDIQGNEGAFYAGSGELSAVIANNKIYDNEIGIEVHYTNFRFFEISNNYIYNNTHQGIFIYDATDSLIISGNVIYNNGMSGINLRGGAQSPKIQNNTIVDNNNGIYISSWLDNSFVPTIQGNIFASNNNFGIYAYENITPIMTCNDVWNNTVNYGGSLTDQTSINGNISLEPLFCGISGSGNFYLQSGSPCSASNVPEYCNGIRIGALPVNCEVGVEEESWGKIKSKFSKKK